MKRHLFVLIGTLVLGGCLGSVDPAPQRNYGFIIMDSRAEGQDYVAVPIGLFYKSPTLLLPDLVARDACFEALHDSTGVGFSTTLDHLDPGNFINLTVSGVTSRLVPRDTLSAILYRPDIPVTFTPGDTALFESAGGADFDPFAIRVKTAEPFTFDAVGLPAAGASLPLTWSRATSAGTKMLVSLRWKNAGEPNTVYQIFCDLVDDGAHAIPSSQLLGWRNALTRQAIAIRERTVAPPTVGATLRVISNFELDVPVNQ